MQQLIKTVFLFTVLTFTPLANTNAAENTNLNITIYKSPTCNCCGRWEKHLEKNGFTITEHKTNDMEQIKKKFKVPGNLQSCHTAEINGYVVEGHVPADVIKYMLDTKPKIKGITVPGMPAGSPGMESNYAQDYMVYSFDENGNKSMFKYIEVKG